MKAMTSPIFAGIDIGASRTKVAIVDPQKNLIGRSEKKSGTDFSDTAISCLTSALQMANRSRSDIVRTISTGYGRNNVTFSDQTKTEIACHAKGCYFHFPKAITVIDIGGQDNKIIKLDEKGNRIRFKMNRKCAAGTGAFLEEMSMRLDIPLADMDGLARRATEQVELGSYCTVFSATEVLEKIRQGKKVPDIVKGLYLSIIKRLLEMDPLRDTVVMSGGVAAYHPFLVRMVAERIGREVLVPDYPQYSGAFGAALFAVEGGI